MQCKNCQSQLEFYQIFCPVCGDSLHSVWFRQSAFCFGGFGTRYHRYLYPGMDLMVKKTTVLDPQCSYPVHFRNMLFFTRLNVLCTNSGQGEKNLVLPGNDSQSYHPVIAPPFLYLIPSRIRSEILRFNLLGLIESLSGGNVDSVEVRRDCGFANARYEALPAVFFDPANPVASYKIAYWEGGELKLITHNQPNPTTIYNFVGTADTEFYSPCFDNDGNIWFADNPYQVIRKIDLSRGNNRDEYRCEGHISALICADNEIYYYQSKPGLGGQNFTFLMRHPRVQMLQMNYNPGLRQPQSINPSPQAHPYYDCKEMLEGVSMDERTRAEFRSAIQPVWIDDNGINAMRIVQNTR